MSKIYFGKNIKTNSGDFSNVFIGNFKNDLTTVYSLPKELTNISNLFNGCSNLKQVNYELESTLLDISSAFANCTKFSQDINIPLSIKNASHAFSGSNIKNAIFYDADNHEENIDLSNAFCNCKNLDSVLGTISNNVSNLAYCFYNSNIKNTPYIKEKENQEYSVNLTSMYENCKEMKECNTYFSKVSGDLDYMFANCISLESYKHDIFANNISYCFDNCIKLTEVGNITGQNMFYLFSNCSQISNVKINFKQPSSSKYYLDNSFFGCTNISTININHNGENCIVNPSVDLKNLNSNCVINLTGEYNIITEYELRKTLNNKNNAYVQGVFFNTENYDIDNDNKYTLGLYHGEYSNICIDHRLRTNPHSSKTEGEVSFVKSFDSKSLDTVYCYSNLSDNLFNNSTIVNFYHDYYGYIPNQCFNNCSNLKDVKINTNIVNEDAFRNCTNLTNIIMNTSDIVFNIQNNVFRNCMSLSNIKNNTYHNLEFGNIGDYGLWNCRNLQLRLPSEGSGYTIGSYALAYIGMNLYPIYDLDFSRYSSVSSSGTLTGMNSIINLTIPYYSHKLFGNVGDCSFNFFNGFYSNGKIKQDTVNIPGSLENVNSFKTQNVEGDDFSGYSNISNLYLPNAVNVINYGFYNARINNIYLTNVNYIYNSGFSNANIDNLVFHSTGTMDCITLGDRCFSNLVQDFKMNSFYSNIFKFEKSDIFVNSNISIIPDEYIIPNTDNYCNIFTGKRIPKCESLKYDYNTVFYNTSFAVPSISFSKGSLLYCIDIDFSYHDKSIGPANVYTLYTNKNIPVDFFPFTLEYDDFHCMNMYYYYHTDEEILFQNSLSHHSNHSASVFCPQIYVKNANFQSTSFSIGSYSGRQIVKAHIYINNSKYTYPSNGVLGNVNGITFTKTKAENEGCIKTGQTMTIPDVLINAAKALGKL